MSTERTPPAATATFGQVIRGCRIDLDVSMGDMARAVGLSVVQWSQIEADKLWPPHAGVTLDRLSALLGADLSAYKRLRCDRESWCHMMDRALLPEANSTKAGMSMLLVTDTGNDTCEVLGVRYRRHHRDPGYMLNVCPWCRESIAWGKTTTEMS